MLIPYEKLAKVVGTGSLPQFRAAGRQLSEDSVTPSGMDARVAAELLIGMYSPSGAKRPPEIVVSLVDQLVTLGGSGVKDIAYGELKRHYPGWSPDIEPAAAPAVAQGSAAQKKPATQKPGRLAVKPQYTIDELVRYGVITDQRLSQLQERGVIPSGASSVARVTLALGLARQSLGFEGLRKLGYEIKGWMAVDIASLDDAVGVTGLSRDEEEILGVLKEKAPNVAAPVEEFYAQGKRFLASPTATLLWLAAAIMEAYSKGGSKPASLRNYAPAVQDALTRQLQVWRGNVQAMKGKESKIRTSSLDEVKKMLERKLKL